MFTYIVCMYKTSYMYSEYTRTYAVACINVETQMAEPEQTLAQEKIRRFF